jgi:hypothetical protein
MDLATAVICASEAPYWRAARCSELKWRYCDDPGVATWAAACPSPLVELGSDR